MQDPGRGTEAVKRGNVRMCREAEREKREKSNRWGAQAKLCRFASLEARVAPNVVRRHSTGAGKQRPPAVVAL